LIAIPSDAAPGPRAGIHRLVALIACFIMATASADFRTLETEDRIASPSITRSLFLDGAAIGDHMVVVGERGRILVSRDAGRTWVNAEVPTRATLTGVDLIDPERGWAVGHDAVILRTRDGGLTWESVYAAPEQERPLLDVWFESAEHGFAVGAYGLFLETRDGGDTWVPRDIGVGDRHLNQISAASSKRLYIAAEAGSVYRSDDGGQSWQSLNVPYAGSFFGTLPVDDRQVYVYGLRGHLFYSSDAGASWRPVDTHTSSLLTNGVPMDGNNVLFTGMDGMLLTGKNAADSLTPVQRADRLGIAGALDAGGGAFLVFGELGVDRLAAKQLEGVLE
jgi:photosystem II stability/assembly factor-like uncharacterized protein